MPLCSYVWWNVPWCKHPLACWRAEAAWALAIRDCKDLAWALTREWALSIRAAKTISTWVLTREWALAWDTTVVAISVHVGIDFTICTFTTLYLSLALKWSGSLGMRLDLTLYGFRQYKDTTFHLTLLLWSSQGRGLFGHVCWLVDLDMVAAYKQSLLLWSKQSTTLKISLLQTQLHILHLSVLCPTNPPPGTGGEQVGIWLN